MTKVHLKEVPAVPQTATAMFGRIGGEGLALLLVVPVLGIGTVRSCVRPIQQYVQGVACHGRCLIVDLIKGDSDSEIVSSVTLWRRTVLTSCVLVACLVVITVLTIF